MQNPPENGAEQNDVTALINSRGLDCSLREMFQTLVHTARPGGGAVLVAALNYGGNMFQVRLDVDLLATPNAGSNPAAKH